jgi:hypothetical protein
MNGGTTEYGSGSRIGGAGTRGPGGERYIRETGNWRKWVPLVLAVLALWALWGLFRRHAHVDTGRVRQHQQDLRPGAPNYNPPELPRR